MAILPFSLLLFLQPVKEITFSGNKSFKAKELIQIVRTKTDSTFSKSILDYDRMALLDFYRKQGFFKTRVVVSYAGDSLIEIDFEIDEGIRPRIAKIYYPADSAVIHNNAGTRPGDFLIEDKILEDVVRVEDYLADHGYPFARLLYYTTFNNDTLFFFWDLRKGKRYFIRHIMVDGLRHVPARLVKHSLMIKEGETFSQEKILDSQKNLYLLFLFRLVEFKYEPQGQDLLDITINLEEGSPLGINLGCGFMTPNRLIASIAFENLNVLRTGNQLELPIVGWINLNGEYSIRTSLGYKFLYPCDLPISLTFGPFIEKEKKILYGRLGYGAQGTVKRRFLSRIEASVSYQYRKVKWEGFPLAEGVTNSITATTIFDFRDDLLDPKVGFFFLPTVGLGGTFLGGDNNFIRYLLDCRLYLPVPGFTYAWRFRMGEIFELPGGLGIHEKYRVISSSALRGYHDYEIGPEVIGDEHYGSFLLGFQNEPRFRFGRFGLVLFLDLGTLESTRSSFKFEDIEIGSGAGLRYFTPIGPVRLDWGKRLKNARPNDIGMIYITLQHAF